jgi:hypothetical protein
LLLLMVTIKRQVAKFLLNKANTYATYSSFCIQVEQDWYLHLPLQYVCSFNDIFTPCDA